MRQAEQSDTRPAGRWEGGRWVSAGPDTAAIHENRYAPFGRTVTSLKARRISAKVIDWILLAVLAGVFVFVSIWWLPGICGDRSGELCGLSSLFTGMLIGFTVCPLIVFGIAEAITGATPGKLVFNVRSRVPASSRRKRVLTYFGRYCLYAPVSAIFGMELVVALPSLVFSLPSTYLETFLSTGTVAIYGAIAYQLVDLGFLIGSHDGISLTQRLVGFEVVDNRHA